MLSQDAIEKALAHADYRIRCAAVGNCKSNTNLSLEFVDKLRKSHIPYERQAAMLACVGNKKVCADWLYKGLEDADFLVKGAAVKAFYRRNDIPLRDVKTLLHAEQWYKRYAGINACVGRRLSMDTIKNWAGFSMIKYLPESFYCAAAAACNENHAVPYRMVERVLREAPMTSAKLLAAKAFGRIYVPTDKIAAMLHESDRFVQMAGLYAYNAGLSIPHKAISGKLIANDVEIRRLAFRVCDKNQLAVRRVIEPPKHVYKKCAGDVVLVARIPEDAQIRGDAKYGYRADRAVIEDVHGDFCEERVGVSLHDHSVDYKIGQEVMICDYDLGYEPMSSGFHFFTDIYQAKAY